MKLFLKVADYYRKPGSQKRMVYVGENGWLFDGPEYNVIVGYTYIVECSSKHLEDRYYHIIKFVSIGKKI
jgi:hypothetical protein